MEPYWKSDVTDDGSPFEISVAFGGRGPELRLLAESQSEPLTPESGWRAGLALNERLARDFGADLSRFQRIQDLFVPLPSIPVRFSMWHGAVLRPSNVHPQFKLYVNPQVVGVAGASRLVERAFSELDMDYAWRFLSKHVSQSAFFIYLSLDLVSGSSARVKVYTAHPGATADQIDSQLRGTRGFAPGRAAEWVRRLAGSREILKTRPVQTCYAFRSADEAPEVTTYVPVRACAANDAEALERACACLSSQDAALLRRVAGAVTDRPLEDGRGLLTYVGVRQEGDRARVTAYLSPQIYSVATPRRFDSAARHNPTESLIRDLKPSIEHDEPATTFKEIQQTVADHQRVLGQHPFLTHLKNDATFDEVLRVVPRVAFFVMCFQDVLRLVYERTTEPLLKAFARTHELEDKGHDLWYLHDLDYLGLACNVQDLFSKEAKTIRDIAYTQIADAINAADDRSRFGIVLALEACGTEFFGSMVTCLERLGSADGLLYFARRHQQVERSHDMFDASAQRTLNETIVSREVLPEVLAVIERTFGTMTSLADDLHRCFERTSDSQGPVA
jgi:hypothetical protein